MAWVLQHRAVYAGQWLDYLPALEIVITTEDERMVDAPVAPGHPTHRAIPILLPLCCRTAKQGA